MNSDGTISGAGGDRPGEPEDWEKTDTSRSQFKWEDRPVPLNVSVPMTYHHILPWKQIWNSWNVVVKAKAWDTLGAWGYILRIEKAVEQIVKRLKRDPATGMAGPLDGPETKDDILTKICWSAWNMVEGPGDRTKGKGELEDPGDALDLHYQVSWKLRQRQNDITVLNGLLDNCRRAQSLPDQEHRSRESGPALKALLKQFKRMRYVRNQSVCYFKPAMWRPAKINSTDSMGNLISAPRYDIYGKASIKRTQKQKEEGSAKGTIRHRVWEKAPRS